MNYKAYKFRMYPSENQKVLLEKHFGCARFVYNKLLKEKQEHYLENKKTLNYNKCATMIVEWKRNEETKWLKEVNSQSLQQAASNLETAYGNFFRTKKGFPKFKRKDAKNTFCVPQHIKIENGKIYFPKFKDGLPVRFHRKLNGKIKSCVVSKTPTEKYFVSILCEDTIADKVKTGNEIGLDLGIKEFIILSDGTKVPNPKHLNSFKNILKKAQRDLSRKVKGSNRYKAQKLKVAKIHEKIANCRVDFLHKLSTSLVEKFDFISVESLAVKNMLKNHNLAGAIADCSWSSFVNMLDYKCKWYGKTLVKIDRWYPSSKTCSNCNHIHGELKLKDRAWTCPKCGTKHDRDVNAAKNIYRAGRSITDMEEKALVGSSGTNETSSCEVSKVSKHYVLKPNLSLAG